MHRSLLFAPLAIALLAVPVVLSARAQDQFADVQITSQPLGGPLHMLQGAGGNMAVCVGEDGVFLVDDQFAPLSDKIRAAIAELSEEPVKFVFNTHWHGDHTGGNESFGKSGSLIVAHENVRQRMSTEQFQKAFRRTTPPSPKAALPVVTFADSVTLHLNGEEIHAFHVPPAHTDGDSVLHFRTRNVIHTGDLFFKDRYPFIDTSSGGTIVGVIAAADRILGIANAETKIVPGHGDLASRADLVKYRDKLIEIRDAVQALIDEGKTREQTIAAKPTAAWDAEWGGGFVNGERITGIAYDSLAPEPAATPGADDK